jgi:hypothetical protein
LSAQLQQQQLQQQQLQQQFAEVWTKVLMRPVDEILQSIVARAAVWRQWEQWKQWKQRSFVIAAGLQHYSWLLSLIPEEHA